MSKTNENSNHSLEHLMQQDILGRIIISNPNPATIILILGPCRTATGALATTIGRADSVTNVHIQPLKAFGRKFILDQGGNSSTPLAFLKTELEISSGNGDHFEIIKETLGPDPHSPAEFINPLGLLLKAGFPPEKIVLIPTSRDPLETVISWKIMWQHENLDEFPFQGFNQSFTATRKIIDQAEHHHIPVIPYVHDLSRDHGESVIISHLFSQIGFPFSEEIIDWGDEDAYWTKTTKYDVPPKRWVVGALGKASGGRGGFVWKPIKNTFTPKEENLVLNQIKPAISTHQQLLSTAQSILGI